MNNGEEDKQFAKLLVYSKRVNIKKLLKEMVVSKDFYKNLNDTYGVFSRKR